MIHAVVSVLKSVKKIVLLVCLFLMLSVPSMAFLYDIKMLSVEEIDKLPDDKLNGAYVEAKIELAASRTFHGKSGFTPKEYQQHKELLEYIVRLRQEMLDRQLAAPPVDEWLR